VRGEKWQTSTLGVHGRNGGPGLYRVVIWLIFGEANKREEQEVEVSMCRMGVRLTLRLQFGKMLLNKISPEFFPAIAQYDRTEGQHSLPTIDAPTHA